MQFFKVFNVEAYPLGIVGPGRAHDTEEFHNAAGVVALVIGVIGYAQYLAHISLGHDELAPVFPANGTVAGRKIFIPYGTWHKAGAYMEGLVDSEIGKLVLAAGCLLRKEVKRYTEGYK